MFNEISLVGFFPRVWGFSGKIFVLMFMICCWLFFMIIIPLGKFIISQVNFQQMVSEPYLASEGRFCSQGFYWLVNGEINAPFCRSGHTEHGVSRK